MVLTKVDRQVRDPARVRLVAAKRPGAERPAYPLHDLGGDGFDERTDAQDA